MPQSMKDLGEEMRRGYEERLDMLNQLRKTTSEMLSDYRQEHKRMAQAQRGELTQDASRRKREVKEMLQGYQADINEASTQWKEFTRLMQRIRRGEKVE